MEDQPRGSHKIQLLQVWCGLLTLAVVVMAVRLATTNLKPAEVSSWAAHPPASAVTISEAKTLIYYSFIELLLLSNSYPAWKESEPRCKSRSLVLKENAIYVNQSGFYFLYAQVTFRKEQSGEKRVFLQRTGFLDGKTKLLAEGIYPQSTESSVWVAKIVSLRKNDSVSINITAEIRKDQTYWGLIELR
uniref:THD domain-containing protein n=1 Tax=Amphilophus citrinellus TaxID=61819 RepID=A0A3Q0T803_AMPCI